MFRERRGEAFSLYHLFRLTNSWTLKCICILLKSLSVCLVGVICGDGKWRGENRGIWNSGVVWFGGRGEGGGSDFGGAWIISPWAHHFGGVLFSPLHFPCPTNHTYETHTK